MKFKLLKDKNFSLLMFGKITSLIGSSMQSFALSLFVLATTGSATKFASILSIALIPQLIFGPIAGVFVDRFNRKKILVILDLISGVVVSIFAVIYFITGELPIVYIYMLAIILSLISTLFQPALQTVLPSIIKKEDLVDANAMNSLILAIGNLAAPAIAGILYGSFGLEFIFILNSITFFVSAFSECFIDIPKINNSEKLNLKLFWDGFSNGIKFSLSNKTVASIVILAMMLNFALGSFTVGVTFVCKRILMVSDFQYGLTESISVAAMMISSLLTGYLAKKYTIGKNVYKSLLYTGIVTAFFGMAVFKPFLNIFSSSLVPYIFIMMLGFVIGLFIGIANIFIGIYFQTIVPLEYMGRVGTVQSTVCMAAMPLSNMMFGLLFDKIDASIIFPISAILVIIPISFYRKVLLSVDIDKHNTNEENLVNA